MTAPQEEFAAHKEIQDALRESKLWSSRVQGSFVRSVILFLGFIYAMILHNLAAMIAICVLQCANQIYGYYRIFRPYWKAIARLGTAVSKVSGKIFRAEDIPQ